MTCRHLFGSLALVVAGAFPVAAQSRPDSLVLRVLGPSAINGTVRIGETIHRYEGAPAPIEIRIPIQEIEAELTSADGMPIAGELLVYRGGRVGGRVNGTATRGRPVRFYYDRTGRFGFGRRFMRL